MAKTTSITNIRDTQRLLLTPLVPLSSQIQEDLEHNESYPSSISVHGHGNKNCLVTPKEEKKDTGNIAKAGKHTVHQGTPEEIKKSEHIAEKQYMSASLPTFNGLSNQDPEEWLIKIKYMLQQEKIPMNKVLNIMVCHLHGPVFKWFYQHQNEITDLTTFEEKFLVKYPSHNMDEYQPTHTINNLSSSSTSKNLVSNLRGFEQLPQEQEQIPNRYSSPLQVLQSAKNEKAKLLPNFTGAENSFNWLKTLYQTEKSLKLDDQQIYELATIKLNGPAQEWYYCQNNEIYDWSTIKEAFLHAFPPPLQPTHIDYLSQLLSRKQGENEPVGKFVQDILSTVERVI